MPALITTLIDKVDTFEAVRDQIGSILVVEEANQRALALAAAKDPDLWAFKTFSERSNPWGEFVDPEEGEQEDANDRPKKLPIVNVWFDNTQIALAGSNLVERQKYTGIFNIDCYGCGTSVESPGGHVPGDAQGAREAQRAARLVRNILMSAHHTYLLLRKTVGRRWVQGIQTFQPQDEGRVVQHVVGARVSLHVDFNELSPQVEGELLELISVGVRRRSDGLLYLTADFPQEL
jgi:hypothetical protein